MNTFDALANAATLAASRRRNLAKLRGQVMLVFHRMKRLLIIMILVGLTSACARLHLRFLSTTPTIPDLPPELVFEDIRYDGHVLSGRLLVGARSPLVLDRRLIEHTSVGLSAMSDCDTHEKLNPLMADVLPPPAGVDDLIALEAGEWFGKEVRFIIFSEPFSPPVGPPCITVDVFLALPETGRKGPVATTRARAQSASANVDAPAEPVQRPLVNP